MDLIKESFNKAKQDIFYLYEELEKTKNELNQVKYSLSEITTILDKISSKLVDLDNKQEPEKKEETIEDSFSKMNLDFLIEQISNRIIEKLPKKQNTDISTLRQTNQTNSTDTSTDTSHIKPLNGQITPISIGNEGVSTDRQTLRQTDKMPEIPTKTQENSNIVDNAVTILSSLDQVKKELRLKFKQLTNQELSVFSLIYELDNNQEQVDYKILAAKLGLTESSVRDYVQRLIKKGISVEKKRINNKNIHLKISENLKKVASLQTILSLRDI